MLHIAQPSPPKTPPTGAAVVFGKACENVDHLIKTRKLKGDWAARGEKTVNINLGPPSKSLLGAGAKARMFGPFQVITADGQDVTPGGLLRRALLAVLVTSPNQMRTRSYLTHMFWACSSPAKSAASLRTALSDLRKELRPLGENGLQSDRYCVRLTPGLITPDWSTSGAPHAPAEFLEGMDLQLRGADDFEDWLRSMRLSYVPKVATASNHAKVPLPPLSQVAPADHLQNHAIAMALMPCRMATPQAGTDENTVNLMIDQLCDLLGQAMPLRLYDYRDHFGGRQGGSGQGLQGTGSRLLLQPTVHGPGQPIRLRLLDGRDQRVVWHGDLEPFQRGSSTLDSPNQLRVFEELLRYLTSCPEYKEEELISPYQALVTMFHLDPGQLDSLQGLIDTALQTGSQPIYHALNCYLATIRSGEKIGLDAMLTRSALINEARSAIRPADFHPYSLSMSGYALAFLGGELDLGTDIARKAVELAPGQAFCWDQLALCQFSAGAFDAAATSAQRAQLLGAHSPLRYTYDTTASIVAFAQGDYLSTIKFGNRALFRMPRFSSALRYTASALAHLDQLGDSRRVLQQLRLINPSINLGQYTQADHLPQQNDFTHRLMTGLKRAGLT